MTIVFATLGFTPQKVLPSVRGRDDVTHVVLFHDRAEASVEAADEVTRSLKDLGVDHDRREVDAFDVAESARAVRQELLRFGDDDRVFNISGGTRVLSAAAMLAAIMEGVRVVYVDERTGREVPLPLMTIRYERLLNEAKRRVLAFIRDHDGACTQTAIVAGLDLSRGTVSHHVRDLKELGLIESVPLEDGRSEALQLIPTADLLLEPPTGDGP